MFLGTLRIPLIDVPSAKTTETPGMETEAQYEPERRQKVIREAREYRVMSKWLRKLYPEILKEFEPFLSGLRRENPSACDLTTTGDFRRFTRIGKGMACRFMCSVCVFCWF